MHRGVNVWQIRQSFTLNRMVGRRITFLSMFLNLLALLTEDGS